MTGGGEGFMEIVECLKLATHFIPSFPFSPSYLLPFDRQSVSAHTVFAYPPPLSNLVSSLDVEGGTTVIPKPIFPIPDNSSSIRYSLLPDHSPSRSLLDPLEARSSNPANHQHPKSHPVQS